MEHKIVTHRKWCNLGTSVVSVLIIHREHVLLFCHWDHMWYESVAPPAGAAGRAIRAGRVCGISPWKCVRRCRRRWWRPTTRWRTSWWRSSAPETTTSLRTRRSVPVPVTRCQSQRRSLLTRLVFLVLQHVYDQKNIRRRVYDALNVLMAMNIISKDKKEIKWIGFPTNSAQECQDLEVSRMKVFWDVSCWLFMNECDPVCLLKAERQRRLERIKHKQSQLQELILQVHCITSCLSELCVQQHHIPSRLYEHDG